MFKFECVNVEIRLLNHVNFIYSSVEGSFSTQQNIMAIFMEIYSDKTFRIFAICRTVCLSCLHRRKLIKFSQKMTDEITAALIKCKEL